MYKKGDIVSAVVTGIQKYGFFVSLEDGCTGLVHISEVSDFYVSSLNEVVQLGDKVDLEVLEADGKQLKLSYKSIRMNMKRGHSVEDLETQSKGKNLLKYVDELIEEEEDML